MLRNDCKPVIFLINNGGYTIERGYMGKTSDYNDIATWACTELPKVFRPDTTARSLKVKTVAGSGTGTQRAQRQPRLHRVGHGSVRRARCGHPQQQQRRRTRLRTPRPAAPRQRAAPAKQLSQLVEGWALTCRSAVRGYACISASRAAACRKRWRDVCRAQAFPWSSQRNAWLFALMLHQSHRC
jgi:hypothetical protein